MPESYASLHGPASDVLTLTWGEEVPGCLYFPKSTWTEGRNRLLREALAPGRPDYLYYVFLDDDLVLRRGDWRAFEAALLKYEPAVGTPFCLKYWGMRSSERLEAHRCLNFDAMCNAFHREVVRDGILLPYHTGLDARSWWFSQWFVIELARIFYPAHTLQFNGVWVDNIRHGEYPQQADLDEADRWFYGEVIKPAVFSWRSWPFLRNRCTVIYRRFRWRLWSRWERFLPPSKRTGNYTVPQDKRQRLLNTQADFWRKRN